METKFSGVKLCLDLKDLHLLIKTLEQALDMVDHSRSERRAVEECYNALKAFALMTGMPGLRSGFELTVQDPKKFDQSEARSAEDSII